MLHYTRHKTTVARLRGYFLNQLNTETRVPKPHDAFF